MITVISGTPGAGKTLYAIEKLLLPEVGKTIKGRDENGKEVEYQRKLFTNINGLQIEHDLIDGGENQGLRDWYKWAPPGALIVFDEVQKVWPPRPNGSKIPEDVQELDTHRHKGVDFILITQSVMNIDRHLHALGGRHLHVRRVGNMKAAIVYEWDHISRSLMFSKSISKQAWRYSKKVFQLYKSSELHTKTKRSIPALIWFILAGVTTLAVGAPMYKDRIAQRFNPQNVEVKADAKENPLLVAVDVEKPAQLPDTPVAAPPAEVLSKLETASSSTLAGCIRTARACGCFDSEGNKVEVEPQICEDKTASSKDPLKGGTLYEYNNEYLMQSNESRFVGVTLVRHN